MNKVYVAGPFFNDKELEFIHKIEYELTSNGMSFYSPRLDGVLMNMTPAERMQSKKRIFDNNVKNIIECDIMVALIDERDTGTIWEMGYASAMKKDIITITNNNYDVNIMLAESVYAHIKSIYDVVPAVQSSRLGSKWLINDCREVY